MNCRDAEEYIFEWVDRRLGGGDQGDLSSHLRKCIKCQMKLEDLLRLRAALQFTKAMDPPPVADGDFADSVMSRLPEEEAFHRHPAGTGPLESIKALFAPRGVRWWLAPAFALLLLFLVPILRTRQEGREKINLIPPMAMKVAKKNATPPKRLERGKAELDEYILAHAHYASESDISYPVVYASY